MEMIGQATAAESKSPLTEDVCEEGASADAIGEAPAVCGSR